ncbi:hypothetical protein MB901379_01671 [Mycobacterium basiliense]|uniref:Uncharacterized protein n=1 Tax=Mycobacterium basiliense TaxID=2094119 RepID=A0A447GCD4_9MYCO|nr:hypothetical protein MB901379_01671 [Mycobacterium basiliense]
MSFVHRISETLFTAMHSLQSPNTAVSAHNATMPTPLTEVANTATTG